MMGCIGHSHTYLIWQLWHGAAILHEYWDIGLAMRSYPQD